MLALLFCLLGILLGVFTGLIPGIHVNTVSLFILSLSVAFDPSLLAVVVIAMAITHTFFDFIPSILLGAPDPETSLSVLPGHRMLLQGKAAEAIYLTVIGGLLSVVITLLLFPLFLSAIPVFYQTVHSYIHILLLVILVSMLFGEKGIRAKGLALFCFFLSGALGLLVFDFHLIPGRFLLFPVFTGLFGISTLLLSLRRGTTIPKQTTHMKAMKRSTLLSGTLKGIFSGALVGTLPAVGSSQAAVLSHQLSRKAGRDDREFLVSLGAVNTIVALFSLISLYTIAKARSGAAIAVQRFLPTFELPQLLVLVSVVLTATGISSLLLLRFTKNMVGFMQRINYRKATIFVILSLVMLTAWFTGPFGLLVLFTSVSIGLLPPLFGVKRTFSMGVLMLPVMFFYLL